MYEGSMMLIWGLIIKAVLLFVVIYILVVCKKKKFEFQSDDKLPKLTKKLSTIPLVVNLSILTIVFVSVIASNVSLNWFVVGLGVFLSLIFSGISAIIGPSISFLGMVFSVVFTRRQTKKRKGAVYIIASCLSFLISYGILIVYLLALTPIAFKYFGFT